MKKIISIVVGFVILASGCAGKKPLTLAEMSDE
jgi:hypothetical protein